MNPFAVRLVLEQLIDASIAIGQFAPASAVLRRDCSLKTVIVRPTTNATIAQANGGILELENSLDAAHSLNETGSSLTSFN